MAFFGIGFVWSIRDQVQLAGRGLPETQFGKSWHLRGCLSCCFVGNDRLFQPFLANRHDGEP